MARQVRSEATRRKILDAAIDVFSEVGYAAAGWNTIIERTGMTKGALYHHFDSKESLASAIIEEGSDAILDAFRNVCGSSSPALENMIHGTFRILDVLSSDKTARGAVQLTAALNGFNRAAANFCATLIELMASQARRAGAEGDVRADLDPVVVSESIVAAVFGTLLLRNAIAAEGLAELRDGGRARGVNGGSSGATSQHWELVLGGIGTEGSLPYFREFLAREALRHSPPAAPSAGDDVPMPKVV
ncbi:TetR/AcrR family transcriptional regulator [Mycobacterium sp.]|uniref:TetR/AcrR family transcriptional regulator n=1 Tax=Mycobacterium sp. TaxID=1785 RepID=UPI0025ECF445|nr:TetR/AcrR family transcriptional regulator [Mycobacterium sp.]MBW0015136.1 TetR/AcrR family transcriptional regulator [Mycobacterium sp.]